MAGDTDDGFDERLPFGCGQGIADGEDFDSAVFLAGSSVVSRERGVGRHADGGDGADGIV